MSVLHLFLFLFFVRIDVGRAFATSPFCDLCPCSSEPEHPPNVNCDLRVLDRDLYDKTLWIDKSNQSYPVDSISLQFHNLRTLNTPFPASELISLNLGNNNISRLGNDVFKRLQKMETLILGYNQLEWIDPNVFRGEYAEDRYFPLTSLRRLDLGHNGMRTLDPDVFEHIDELRVLILRNNPIRVIDARTSTAVASLVFLEELDLSGCQLSSLPDYFLHTPKFLARLDLSGNALEAIPRTLGDSHALEQLDFSANPVRNLTKHNGFPRIATLHVLRFSRMPLLETIGAHSMSGLSNLRELRMTDNPKLTEIHPHALMSIGDAADWWPAVKTLLLRNNSLAYLDRNVVNRWSELRQLDLTDNPWSCDCQNQWFLDELLPIYDSIDQDGAGRLTCQSPIEMQNSSLHWLHLKQTHMRCLDYYGNRPEKDALILVGTLTGLLTLLIVVALVVYVYRSRRFHHGIFSGFVTGRPYYSHI